MKSLLALVMVVAFAGVAHAERFVSAPTGWSADDTHATMIRSHLQNELPPGVPGSVEVYSYRPAERGAQLIASLVAVQLSGDAGAAWVRERIDSIHGTPAMMAGDTGKVRTIAWAEKSDDKTRLVEANLEWAHDDNGTISVVRAVWLRRVGGDVIEEYRGECVMSADLAATMQPACAQALAQITLPAVDQRQTVAAVAAVSDEDDDDGEDGEAAAPATATTTPATPDEIRRTPDDLEAVEKKTPAPSTGSSRDNRPFWVAGGLLVLIAALLWGRKRRAELLAEEEKRAAEAKKPEAPEEAPKEEESKEPE